MFFFLLQCPIIRASWCSSYNTPNLPSPDTQGFRRGALQFSHILYFNFARGVLPLSHSLNKLMGMSLPTRCLMLSHWSQKLQEKVPSPFYSDSQHWTNVSRILDVSAGATKWNVRLVAYTAFIFCVAPEARSQDQKLGFLNLLGLQLPVLTCFFLCAKSLSVWVSKFPFLRTPVRLINLPNGLILTLKGPVSSWSHSEMLGVSASTFELWRTRFSPYLRIITWLWWDSNLWENSIGVQDALQI